MKNKHVLVVGPSKKTRGGITSVINAQKSTDIWQKWNCIWVETYIDGNNIMKIAYFAKGLLQFLLKVKNSSIIHIHYSGKISASRKSVFVFIAKIYNIPVISHYHAFSYEDTLYGSKKKLYQWMFKKSEAIIVLSEYWKNKVKEFTGGKSNVLVIYNPCQEIHVAHNKAENYILYAGTLNKRKGYLDLIKSFSKIEKKNQDWKLVLAGNGEIEKGKKYAKELGLENSVKFLGWISGAEKNSVFEKARIFCLPSYAEGFPMAILDAWAFGLPVITTPVGGLNDILVHQENSLIFQPGDIAALSENLDMMINDEYMRKKISEQSRIMANGIFSIGNISRKIDDLYATVSGKRIK